MASSITLLTPAEPSVRIPGVPKSSGRFPISTIRCGRMWMPPMNRQGPPLRDALLAKVTGAPNSAPCATETNCGWPGLPWKRNGSRETRDCRFASKGWVPLSRLKVTVNSPSGRSIRVKSLVPGRRPGIPIRRRRPVPRGRQGPTDRRADFEGPHRVGSHRELVGITDRTADDHAVSSGRERRGEEQRGGQGVRRRLHDDARHDDVVGGAGPERSD